MPETSGCAMMGLGRRIHDSVDDPFEMVRLGSLTTSLWGKVACCLSFQLFR